MRKKNYNKWITVAVTAGLVLGLAGCAGSGKRKTIKEEATQNWNAARATVLAGLAQDQYKSGNFDKCRLTLAEAMRMDPTNARLHVLSAKLAIEQGKLETADRELKTARQLDPKDAEADYLSGVIAQRWQKTQQAYEHYNAASTKAPDELPYLLAKAEMLVSMDRSDEALALLTEKSSFFEHSAVIRDAAGQLLVQQKRYAEAADLLRQASVLDNTDETIREHLAMALFYNKQYREARDVLVRVLKNPQNSKRAELHLTMGECHLQLNRPADARSSFETAAQLNPGSLPAMTGLAKAALELNDFRRADLAIRKATSMEPNSAQIALLAGYLRVRENKLGEAIKCFEQASQLDRTDTVSVCMIGYVLEKSGKRELAKQHYNKALKMKPGDEMATSMLASVNVNE